MKPRSFLKYALDMTEVQLAKEITPEPRSYFRGSEIGRCSRQVAADMLGKTQRPQRVRDYFSTKSGNLYHCLIREWLSNHFVIDGAEGIFTISDSNDIDRWPFIQEKVKSQNRVESIILKLREEVDIESRTVRICESDIHVKFTHKDIPLETHFRPDGILIGIKTKPEERWDGDDWCLLEIKSTTSWGVDEAQKSCKDTTTIDGWFPSYAIQAQVYMHFLGLNEARILQVSRDHFDMLMDDKQAATRKKPEHQWKPIKYDPEQINQIFDRMVMIKEHVDRGELPPPECPGQGWVFNNCQHNTVEVSGLKSAIQCGGKYG